MNIQVYSVIERNNILLDTTTWINFENMLSEISISHSVVSDSLRPHGL